MRLSLRLPVAVSGRPVGFDFYITSPNPSGGYTEGVAVGGTLTANKPATWSKSGPDASRVTLNPSTGVWSLETTVFATKPSYSFIFTATAPNGAIAQQPVVIAVIAAVVPTIYNTPGGSSLKGSQISGFVTMASAIDARMTALEL